MRDSFVNATPGRCSDIGILFAVTLLLIVGIITQSERTLRDDLLKQAHLVASALDVSQVQTFSATEKDLNLPAYQQLRNTLAEIHLVNPNYRFVYLMGQKPNNMVFVYADSEPLDSPDASPPGQLYTEVPKAYLDIFDSLEAQVVGPVTDRWGTWLTALIPLLDKDSGELIALLGLDIDAAQWRMMIFTQALLPILLLFLLIASVIVTLLLILLHRQAVALRVQQNQLQQNEKQLAVFFAQSLTGFFFMVLDRPLYWSKDEDNQDALLDYALNNMRMSRVNQAMLDQYGAREEDFIGLSTAQLFAHDIDQGRKLLRDLFNKGRLHSETSEKHLDGSEIIIEGDYICFYDAQGRVIGHFGVQTDITERKRLEQTLCALNGDLAQMSGHVFYRAACRLLTEVLDTDIAFIARLQNAGDKVEIIDGWADGQPMTPFVYPLLHTPCKDVIKHTTACYPEAVQILFPRDELLTQMGIEAYLGQTLFDRTEQPLGIVVTLGRKPLTANVAQQANALLALFIDRMTSEVLRTDAEQGMQHRLIFERIAAETATALAKARTNATIDTVIEQCLQRLGVLFGADRCYLFQFMPDLDYASNTHEWCAAGIDAQQKNLQDFPMHTICWWKEQLLKHGLVYIASLHDLPKSAQSEYTLFTQQGIQSLINVGMYGAYATPTGFIGLDSVHHQRHWSKDDVTMLQTMAGIIGAGLERRRVDTARQAAEQRASLQRTAIAELVLNPAFQKGEITDSLEQLTQVLSATLNVTRVSFWVVEENLRLHCIVLNDTRSELDYPDVRTIEFDQCPRYIKALQSAQRIDAEDVTNDPRTNELVTNYFNLVGVNSLLDAGVFTNGVLTGVISAEHTESKRHWHSDEHAFISIAAAIVTQLFLNERRRESEQQARHINEILNITGHIAGVGAWALDIPNAKLWWSEETFRIHGLKPGDQPNVERAIEFYTPESRPIITQAVNQSIAEGMPWDLQLQLVRADGQSIWVHTIGIVEYLGDEPVRLVGALHDITASRLADARLKQAASVFEHASEGILIADAKVNILDVNAAFTRITGYQREEVLGQNPSILSAKKHDQSFYAKMWQGIKQQGRWSGEVWNSRKNGEIYAALLTISAVYDANAQIQRYVALFVDISAQKAYQYQLEHLAHYDALTNLPNRVLFADRLRQAMARAQRRGDKIAIAYLDLDGFKAINDHYGHDIGDHFLVSLAKAMQATLRDTDTLARLGGDEFVAVLTDLPDLDTCLPLLQRLLDVAAQAITYGGQVLQVSGSLGVSYYPQAQPIDADQLLRQADQAMYQAKLAGKNRYYVFDAEHDHALRGRHEEREQISRGLTEGEFVLYYQPKVNMREGRVIGAEALIRWQHPERGVLSPAVFLPLLDNHPLMIELGDWVIDAALAQIQTWHSMGMSIPVSVNVDAMQLNQVDFIAKLGKALDRYPEVQPGNLELELLETSTLHDINHISQILRAGQKLGVTFALDDFGTGYSSLSYLKRLPAETIKIDQSFVRDMLDDPDDLAILQSVIGLAEVFHRHVIAEGVETTTHGQMLLQLGCELAQGYAIARPMPANEIPNWYASWQPVDLWRTTLTIAHDKLPVLFAIIEHHAWMIALSRYLDNQRIQPPILDSQQCNIQNWLDANKLTHAIDAKAHAQLHTLHNDLHTYAQELVTLKHHGDHALTSPTYAKLEVLHQSFLHALRQQLG